jgi:hypothetical protein
VQRVNGQAVKLERQKPKPFNSKSHCRAVRYNRVGSTSHSSILAHLRQKPALKNNAGPAALKKAMGNSRGKLRKSVKHRQQRLPTKKGVKKPSKSLVLK